MWLRNSDLKNCDPCVGRTGGPAALIALSPQESLNNQLRTAILTQICAPNLPAMSPKLIYRLLLPRNSDLKKWDRCVGRTGGTGARISWSPQESLNNQLRNATLRGICVPNQPAMSPKLIYRLLLPRNSDLKKWDRCVGRTGGTGVRISS